MRWVGSVTVVIPSLLTLLHQSHDQNMQQAQDESKEEKRQLGITQSPAMSRASAYSFESLRLVSHVCAERRRHRRQWRRMRASQICDDIVSHYWFSPAVVTIIVLNTLALAIYYPRASRDYIRTLEGINYFCTGAFILELALKVQRMHSIHLPLFCVPHSTQQVGASSWKDYLSSSWNRFDCLVVLLSITEIIVEQASSASTGSLSVFRAFRLLRVLKLAQSW